MNKYHVLYKLKDDVYASGVNIEATNVSEALKVFAENNDINTVVAVYNLNIRQNVFSD